MAQQYQPGQRWISDSEAELGLGTVLAQDGRLLQESHRSRYQPPAGGHRASLTTC